MKVSAIQLTGVGLLLGVSLFGTGTVRQWDSLLHEIRGKYPAVRQLSTAGLAMWLADDKRKPPLLLDARGRKEFAVSHLKNARRVTSIRQIKDEPKERPIVFYCSVGYRSSRLAAAAMKRGYTNVYNLEGSLFKWANEGRVIHREDRPVDKVHPYNAKWGAFLHDAYHPER